MVDSDQQLVDNFIKAIPIVNPNTRILFSISFIGNSCCGKTFIAKKISEKLNLYIYVNDTAKRYLNNLGFEGETPAPHILNKISVGASEYLYKNNISHIIDADLIRFHDSAKQIAENCGAKLYIIEIVCSEDVMLERIKQREENIRLNKEASFSRAVTKEYFERKKLHDSLPKPEFFFSIDASLDIDNQIDDLILKLKKEKII